MFSIEGHRDHHPAFFRLTFQLLKLCKCNLAETKFPPMINDFLGKRNTIISQKICLVHKQSLVQNPGLLNGPRPQSSNLTSYIAGFCRFTAYSLNHQQPFFLSP